MVHFNNYKGMSERIIKFRIIYKNKKINGYERLIDGNWEWMCLELNPDKGERWVRGVYPHSDLYTRDQFTGLHDKEGKDIYDKDVVIVWCDADPTSYSMKALVYWDDELLGWYLQGFHPSGKTTIESLSEHQSEHIVIVGNIYSTPELLDSTKLKEKV
jgi:uncharacterized phage protein (TIGR01671 family)